MAAGTRSIALKNVSFNHPVRHVVVALQRQDFVNSNADLTQPVDALVPYQKGSAAGEYRTPLRWNDFSAGFQLGTNERLNPVDAYQLKINNYDRLMDVSTGIGEYYNEVHTSQKAPGATQQTFGLYYFFGQYGFGSALSGTLNFSAIDNVEIDIIRAVNPSTTWTGDGAVDPVDYPAADVYVYACGSNVLKFVSGMAGLAFAS